MSIAKTFPAAVVGAMLAAQAPFASAGDVDAGYFTGKWVINGKCSQADGEYMHLRDNGTLEYGRRGKAEKQTVLQNIVD